MKYTCQDYRKEMILASLEKRLAKGGLNKEEQQKIKEEIKSIETAMGID